MKTESRIILVFAIILALFHAGCTNPPAVKINTPAVRAQVLGDLEKTLLAGGGALLISGGSTRAAVAAMTAQEIQNIPQLQKALDAANKPVTSAKNPPN